MSLLRAVNGLCVRAPSSQGYCAFSAVMLQNNKVIPPIPNRSTCYRRFATVGGTVFQESTPDDILRRKMSPRRHRSAPDLSRYVQEAIAELKSKTASPTDPAGDALVFVLDKVKSIAGRSEEHLKPADLARVHQALVMTPEVFLGEHGAAEIAFRFTLESFTFVLKYAAYRRDLGVLRTEGQKAFFWLAHRRFHLHDHIRSRQRIRRERAQIRRLVRNLVLTASIQSGKTDPPNRRSSSPSLDQHTGSLGTSTDLMGGDDIHALRALIRRRVGVLKLDNGEAAEAGQQELSGAPRFAISRFNVTSRHFPFRQSRLLRQVNLLAQRDQLFARCQTATVIASNNKAKQDEGGQAVDSDEYHLSRKLDKLLDRILKGKEVTSDPSDDLNTKKRILRRWRRPVKGLRRVRARVIDALSALPKSPFSDETDDMVEALTPTWLLLDALKSCTESGFPARAERIISRYLADLQRSSGMRADEVHKALPYDQRILAVTEPHKPPNSPSLLNALLRAHLTNGATDSWKDMLYTIERWCIHGQGFAESIFNAIGDRGGKRHLSRKRPSEVSFLPCLYPDETSVMILVDAAKPSYRRRGRLSENGLRALSIIDEMWKRWAPMHMQPPDSQDAVRSSKAASELRYPLRLTVKTFRLTLAMAITYRSREDVQNVLSAYDTWMRRGGIHTDRLRFGLIAEQGENVNRLPLNTGQFRRHGFGPNVVKAKRERSLWIRTLQRAINKGLLDVNTAEQTVMRWDFIPRYTHFTRTHV